MIYFVRHGQSQANLDNIYAGRRINSPLTEKGIEQAELTGMAMVSKGVEDPLVICSTMSRAVDTAKSVAAELGVDESDITYDKDLEEWDFGELSGQTKRSMTTAERLQIKGVESVNDFRTRIARAFLRMPKDKDVIVVAHGDISRLVQAIRDDADIKDFADYAPIDNCELLEIDHQLLEKITKL
ncbi:MAG: histidine phosphatase family protein [Patescibacteria group bacterium]